MNTLTLRSFAIISCFILGVAGARIIESLTAEKLETQAACKLIKSSEINRFSCEEDERNYIALNEIPNDLPIYLNALPVKPPLEHKIISWHCSWHSYSSPAAIEDIIDWYNEKMIKNGWKIDFDGFENNSKHIYFSKPLTENCEKYRIVGIFITREKTGSSIAIIQSIAPARSNKIILSGGSWCGTCKKKI